MIRPRKKPRPGRLKGLNLKMLRLECYLRDCGRCQNCFLNVSDRVPDWHDGKFHMAHIKAKRNGGDSLSNVRTLCGKCHRLEHAYGKSGKKPCPPKPRARVDG